MMSETMLPMIAGDEMKVFTHIEVDRNELPILVELSDMQVAAKRCLFAYIRRELKARGPDDGLAAAMLRGLPDTGCLLTRGDDLAIISVWVPPDYVPFEGAEFPGPLPVGGFVRPEVFSCSWDPETGGLVYNATDN